MKVFDSIAALQLWRNQINNHTTIGFVPTMGALHQGHISLVNQSKMQCDITVSSIFVNPTQFNNPSDFNNYPNTLENDLNMLQKSGCDAVFTPNIAEIYPDGYNIEKFNFSPFDEFMEGQHRPGHFDGVGTIVSKLFEIVQPQIAFFGEKDFQQLKVIEKLVEIKKYKIKIKPCPIVREPNGLAMSSRNLRLSQEEQVTASIIYKTLNDVKKLATTHTASDLKQKVNEIFSAEKNIALEYFEICSENDLQPTENLHPANRPRAFIAAVINQVRLIDNLALFG